MTLSIFNDLEGSKDACMLDYWILLCHAWVRASQFRAFCVLGISLYELDLNHVSKNNMFGSAE
jgi:hypothetical protein